MTCSLAQWSFLSVTETGTSLFTDSNFHLDNTNSLLQGSFLGAAPQGQAHHKKLPLHKAFCIPSQTSGLQDMVSRARSVFTLLFFPNIILYLSSLMDNPKLIYSFFQKQTHTERHLNKVVLPCCEVQQDYQ